MRELSGVELKKATCLVDAIYLNDTRVQGKRSTAVGTGFACRHIYDMWHLDQRDRPHRSGAVALGVMAAKAFDIMDDIVDGIADPEKKLAVYDDAAFHMIGGVCRCKQECPDVFRMALAMHQLLMPPSQPTADSCARIVAAGREQITSSDERKQYEAMQSMGAHCMLLLVNAGEVIDAKTAPRHLTDALANLGMFAYFQDVALEVDDDIASGAQTYATLRIDRGDDPSIVTKEMLVAASRHRRTGADHLEVLGERWRYHMLSLAISVKNHL